MTADVECTLISPNIETVNLHGATADYSYVFLTGADETFVINQEDNTLDDKYVIASDGTSQFVMTSYMTTDNPNISPIVDIGRTNLVTVKNSILDIDGEAVIKDAGSYVTETVNLANLSNDLRVIFDSRLPAGSYLNVFYKTSTFTPKYVTLEDTLTPIYESMNNNTNHVYWRKSDGTLLPKSSAVVTRTQNNNDPDTDRYYLSSVEDYGDFVNAADFATDPDLGAGGHVILTPDVDITSMPDWLTATSYNTGDYAISGNKLWKCLLNHTSTTAPLPTSLNWQQIDMVYVITEILNDDTEIWRPMAISNDISSEIDTAQNFIEYEYEPEEYPDEEFDTFAIKIDLVSNDYVNTPLIRNFKAIAVI